MGYTEAQVTGTDSETCRCMGKMVSNGQKTGGKGLLLWAGDESCYEVLKQIADTGCIVGIPHFNQLTTTQTRVRSPEGLSFNMACSPVL